MDDWFDAVPCPDVIWQPQWLPLAEAQAYQARIRDEVVWRQEQMRTPRGMQALPRLTAWQGDPGAEYRYSGIVNLPAAWSAAVQELRKRVELSCGASFNSVLLNRYRDGRDSMGWHADDEAELGPRPVIASLSLGVPRRFEFRHRLSGVVQLYRLMPGSLLVMHGRSQQDWVHRIPKVTGLTGERLNLTFRWVNPRA